MSFPTLRSGTGDAGVDGTGDTSEYSQGGSCEDTTLAPGRVRETPGDDGKFGV